MPSCGRCAKRLSHAILWCGLGLKAVILRSGGELHIADFGKPHNTLMWSISIVRWLKEGGDNVKGLRPVMIRDAGLETVEETGHYSSAFEILVLLKAVKPKTRETG